MCPAQMRLPQKVKSMNSKTFHSPQRVPRNASDSMVPPPMALGSPSLHPQQARDMSRGIEHGISEDRILHAGPTDKTTLPPDKMPLPPKPIPTPSPHLCDTRVMPVVAWSQGNAGPGMEPVGAMQTTTLQSVALSAGTAWGGPNLTSYDVP